MKFYFYTPSPSDVDEIIEIQKRAYIKNYVNERFGATFEQILAQNWQQRKQERLKQLQDPDFLWIALKDREKIIAYGSIANLSQKTLILKNIIVDPDFQKQGLGTKIVDYLLKNCPPKPIELETTLAGEFYKKFGFEFLQQNSPKMLLNKEKLEVYKHKPTT